jgi:hypothetical protein
MAAAFVTYYFRQIQASTTDGLLLRFAGILSHFNWRRSVTHPVSHGDRWIRRGWIHSGSLGPGAERTAHWS